MQLANFLLTDTALTPDDPRFIGAWWLGLVILAAMSLFIALPLFLFTDVRRDNTETKNTKRSRRCVRLVKGM